MDENAPIKNSKKWQTISVVVLLVILAGLFFYNKKRSAAPKPATSVQSQTVETKKLGSAEISSLFPSDLPVEVSAQVTQNFQRVVDGHAQAVKAFVSQKTLDQNFQIYQQYFQQHGWQLGGQINQTAIKSIHATKDGDSLDVLMQQSSGGQKTVTLTFTSK